MLYDFSFAKENIIQGASQPHPRPGLPSTQRWLVISQLKSTLHFLPHQNQREQSREN